MTMKILLTGASGYIGQRLLQVLLDNGHEVICCVRDFARFDLKKYESQNVSAIEVDFLNSETLINIPRDIDSTYYLIHSMSTQTGKFEELEALSAHHFIQGISNTSAKQIIYLSGIANETILSKHLSSRKNVEQILGSSRIPLTTLRAGIIVGSGSASFEIIRDLVEKLPIMIAPRWLHTKTQPIAIRNVLDFLHKVLLHETTYNRSFDIGGNEVLTYKEMLLQFAEVRELKRWIGVVPVMTPKLSSYWLYFITTTTYSLARNLVDSMKVEVVCRKNDLAKELQIDLIDYKTAIKLAFDKIEQNHVISSWMDALTTNTMSDGLMKHLQVPQYGCFKDHQCATISDIDQTLYNIWIIGGNRGWYYANWLWTIRGFIDKLMGGIDIRRGRKNEIELSAGEALDFWRVVVADKKNKRLLLYAEMKLPGEGWLEFRIEENKLHQTATFRPLGLIGRLYWYSMLPFHIFIFRGMIRNIAN